MSQARISAVIAFSAITFGAYACSSSDNDSPSPKDAGTSSSANDSASPLTSETNDAATDGPPSASGSSFFTRTGGTFAATLDVSDGTAFVTPTSERGADVKTELRVFFSDRDNLCTKGPNRQNETVLALDLLSGAATLEPGTFTQKNVDEPGQADVSLATLDGTCKAGSLNDGADEATVTLTTVSATRIAGTIDVTFANDGGTLTGTFDVPVCGQTLSGACSP